ncbi:Alpha/Beta hydrolase protein [Stachybotrys elegans]|uniref:Alpha/Beta hydrolase protein n=1 Tax=Stachybotrys elegans TaxID=80388 RepID=A0A8K0WPK9_9HYPO|nr:Alpha/Beta hydrolase protein [Stachybotrys elegans]
MATYESAPNQVVAVNGNNFAYRRLGRADGVPLVLLMGFRGTMDHWDPALVNPLAALRPVLLIDNAGVGRSEGEIPKTFVAWAEHYIDVLSALRVARADVMGFSMGGCVAQLMALNAPNLVRRLILCGTIPSAGDGVIRAPIGPFNKLSAATTLDEHRVAFLETFFTTSYTSQAAGAAAWHRIITSRSERSDFVGHAAAHRQAVAFAKFMDPNQARDASYQRLHELTMPILIANGSDDLLLPTSNSVTMWQKLSHANAQLHLYPNSGHGFLYQYAPQFAKLLNDFLDGDDEADDGGEGDNNSPRPSRL